MELYYNVRADQRRQLAHAIADHLGEECVYHGTPNFEYTIGAFTVDRVGAVIFESDVPQEVIEQLQTHLKREGFAVSDTKMQIPTKQQAPTEKLVKEYKNQDDMRQNDSNTSLDGCSTCWNQYISCCSGENCITSDTDKECCLGMTCLGCMSM